MLSKKIVIIILATALILIGGFFLFSKFDWRKEVKPSMESFDSLKKAENDWNISIQKAAETDKDLDGISDADEAKFGTDPNSSDSDSDGLLDKVEIEMYKTDPLNPDTDGDGQKDGYEVRRGLNPKGQGKL